MDDSSLKPTAAQLEEANLVAVTTINGKPVRSYDSVHKNFPPTTVYATPVTPPATKYTVTFHDASGGTISTMSETAGATFTLPAAPTMPAGETFESWADGQHTYAPGVTYTMPAANVTFVVEYTTTPPITPPITPPTELYPPMPTTAPPGYVIDNAQSFAGLTGCPKGWFLYGGQPGGQPQAYWEQSLVEFNEFFVSLPTQAGPIKLPNGNMGYLSSGIGDNTHGLIHGRWDFCVRLAPHATSMSMIGLLWPDGDPRPWPVAGESDGLETWGSPTGWNMTEHYQLNGQNKNPQCLLKQPAGFDSTEFFIFSMIRESGKTTCLINGVEAGFVQDTNIPDTMRYLDFQVEYTGTPGKDVPVTPCPMDVAWAVQYSLAA